MPINRRHAAARLFLARYFINRYPFLFCSQDNPQLSCQDHGREATQTALFAAKYRGIAEHHFTCGKSETVLVTNKGSAIVSAAEPASIPRISQTVVFASDLPRTWRANRHVTEIRFGRR